MKKVQFEAVELPFQTAKTLEEQSGFIYSEKLETNRREKNIFDGPIRIELSSPHFLRNQTEKYESTKRK